MLKKSQIAKRIKIQGYLLSLPKEKGNLWLTIDRSAIQKIMDIYRTDVTSNLTLGYRGCKKEITYIFKHGPWAIKTTKHYKQPTKAEYITFFQLEGIDSFSIDGDDDQKKANILFNYMQNLYQQSHR